MVEKLCSVKWDCYWNEWKVKRSEKTRNNWRASLVPAAAVIPAPIAYIKVVAVKKLVVGYLKGFFASLWSWKILFIRLLTYMLPCSV